MRLNKKKGMKSSVLAAVYFLVWLAVILGIKLLADNIAHLQLLHIVYVMMIVPAGAFVTAFIYSRKGGIKLWLLLYMGAAVLIMYAAFGFNELSPDFLVTNVIFIFFGCGLGNVFKDEAAALIQQEIDNEKKAREAERERSYVSILDDKKGKKE